MTGTGAASGLAIASTADLSAYLPPPVPSAREQQTETPLASILSSEWSRDRLSMIAAGSERSRQTEMGASEIGTTCPRRLAYRAVGAPIANLPDPLKAMFGTGMHEVLAAGLADMNGSASRYLIEHAVRYRGVLGHIDLFDRLPHRLIDWKTTAKDRIRRYRSGGPPSSYVVQAQIYAAGLAEAGERVETIALVFIPRDGTLSDVWSWTTTPNRAIADKAIDRYESIAAQARQHGPAGVDASPSNLCGYCPNYRPHATELSVACPGEESK